MKLFVLSTLYLAMVVAMPYEIIEDEHGQQYYAIPINREKR